MKSLVSLAVVAVFAISGTFALMAEQPRSNWKQVDQAIKKGLPKTAIKHLGPIIRESLRQKDYAKAAKAIGMKISLESQIQGNKPEERIVRLETEIAKMPKALKPIMEVILAHWYWQYFQQNRWRFMQRTHTEEAPGKYIKSWDLPRILAEIDKHYTAAFQAEKWLKATSVNQFDELLRKGTMPDAYRPTMYDFVAYEAIQFYTAGEQAGSKAEDTFVLQADSPIFAPADQFMAWEVNTTDRESPTVKAIGLYQKLLAFHQRDDDRSAFADADLHRLEFANAKAFGEEKNVRYKAALKRFTHQWAELPVSARARYAHAQVLRTEGKLVEAHDLAKKGWKTFPDSPGGKLCYNLVHQIESKSIQVSSEHVWNKPWPTIRVQYRNLTKVHFRAVRYQWESLLDRRDYYPGSIPRALRNSLLASTPDKKWSSDLPPTEDYQEKSVDLPTPKDLRPGFYFLLASAKERPGSGGGFVMISELWVSRLAVVVRTGLSSSALGGFVLDAETGEPIAGATVRGWYRNRSQWSSIRSVQTDSNGLFNIEAGQRRNAVLLAEHDGQKLATRSLYARSGQRVRKPYQRTLFFTDRSIYRPGQTIRYKGICIDVNQQQDNYKTVSEETITVVFKDANGQNVAEQRHRTNQYGSFSGSFTAPRDRLPGQMRLYDLRRPGSVATFSVEEYKRPKFRVTVDNPTEPAQLGGKVQVQGTAKAYTGAPINGAKVAYRVVRNVRYPIWCGWWGFPPIPPQEIAHGTAVTDADGKFTIPFTARPDPSASEKDEPVFHFEVHADVTDTTGETRWGERTINVGYRDIQAVATADSWQTIGEPVELRISTTSLNGDPRAAKGAVKIHELKQPEQVIRSSLVPQYMPGRGGRFSSLRAKPSPDPSNPESWDLGPVVSERAFATDASGAALIPVKLKAGIYRVMLKTEDSFGRQVTARLTIRVLDPKSRHLAIKVANLVDAPRWELQPDETFTALWGTGYKTGRAFVEIEHRGKILQSYWTRPKLTQATIEQGVTEAMRGGFTLRVTQVRENRAYAVNRSVSVPWTNKNLSVRWEHFTSKLKPGQSETWTLNIKGPKAVKMAAELVATLYDASLDAYRPHHWPSLNVFRHDYSRVRMQFENYTVPMQHVRGIRSGDSKSVSISYRSLPPEIIGYVMQQFGVARRGGMLQRSMGRVESAPAMMADGAPAKMMRKAAAAPAPAGAMAGGAADKLSSGMGGGGGEPNGRGRAAAPKIDLSGVSARVNLNETAFFFPQMVAGPDGNVKLEFSMPEALTEWKFFGFAHDTQLRSGLLTDTAVTSKDLMVQPLPPRFVREGDALEFTVKVTNQSASRQTGTVRLTFADARTTDSMDSQLHNATPDQAFDVPAKQSRTYSWHVEVPDGMGFLTYKAVGSTGRLSDGEQGYLPVLSRRILVTESLPLPIRGAKTKKFDFAKLIASGKSDTLRNESLTVQMVSNPAWYAVMALPYLMEYPYECTEQTFNRLYANALARHIANADPKIRRVFDQWKGTPALDSPLEKNQDLKAVMLEETPWVRDARKESQARRNVGILFDANRLNDETARVFQKLTQMQLSDGAWPWFPGGRANDYITLYITTGFGRLRHLGADVDVSLAVKSLTRLDGWIDRVYRKIVEHGNKKHNHLSPTIALYLYGRSFFLDDMPVNRKHREAVDYFLGQAKEYWLQLRNRQSEGHLAIALKRFQDLSTAQDIMRSIKEHSVTDDELGMFWRDTELSWWWYRAPIETQAMMIEAFDEVMNDAEAVELCRVWLLKQKQTQDWKTTKATADAIYGLLLRGTDFLASDELVRVKLGDIEIKPENVEAGTGFYEQKFLRKEIKHDMGRITVTKTDSGVAWGSVHWQYLEDMSKVTPYEGTPLTLRKKLYVKVNTKKGPVLQAVKGPVSVGDELVTRIELRVDRDMEYVHLKDQRPSGVEPVNVISRYRYQDGLAYYETTRDTASHFFIDYLPKGTYVFEYSTRIVHRGTYQSGMSQIQCMYAPEFNSHSGSVFLKVE